MRNERRFTMIRMLALHFITYYSEGEIKIRFFTKAFGAALIIGLMPREITARADACCVIAVYHRLPIIRCYVEVDAAPRDGLVFIGLKSRRAALYGEGDDAFHIDEARFRFRPTSGRRRRARDGKTSSNFQYYQRFMS